MKFQNYQRAFTAHIRDPRAAPRPKGVEARRMRVYNELLINNVEGFLLACFPVSRNILGKRRWQRLLRGFFRDHACATPYFRQIPEEFLRYLAEEWQHPDDYPEFIGELLHYEWVELELETSARDTDLPEFDPDGDLLDARPLLNPVLRLLAYRYPVQRLSPRHKPTTAPAQPTFILAFRDGALRVRFEVINAATARLLELLLEDEALTGRAALSRLAAELTPPDPAALIAHGAGILTTLHQRGAILGSRLFSAPSAPV